MASTYVNNLRLEEIATGEQSGTWGNTTNTNLEIIGQVTAWGTRAIANASTDNITLADGALDADRSLVLKLTGGGQACTVTLLPNTSSKTWVMYNTTSATLTFTCGSGANVAVLAGESKIIATDGLGSGGVVYDVLTGVNLAGTTKVDDLVVGDDATVTDDLIVGGDIDLEGSIDVNGTANLDVVDIDGAVQLDATLTVGANDQGYDVILYGDTAARNATWDSSADSLEFTDNTKETFGTGNDMQLYHDGTNSFITNSQGVLKLATETSGIALTLGHSTSEVTFGDNVTVVGNFAVNGTTTTINTTNLTVTDPLVKFGQGYTGTAYDQGFIVTRGNGSATNTANKGFIWDETADEFVAIACNTENGTTAGNVTINSYVDMQVAKLTGSSLDISGDIDVDGTTNLDIVDIDGAVNMAGTAVVIGVLSTTAATVFNGGFASNADSTLGTNKKVQFRDSAIYINSSADGQLDIVADTEIQIAATTIDINGAINASGEIIAGSLDISGDIDVDGTTNLDVVDIDGAVNMAATAVVIGVLSTTAEAVFNGGFASNADSIMGTNKKIKFRDAAIYINSSADGQLDIVADTEIQIAATTIDINGAVDVSGDTTIAGDITSGKTVHVEGSTAAGDNAAIGYASGEGLILTGQGSNTDVVMKNDAGQSVLNIPTGTRNVVITAGDLTTTGELNVGTTSSGDGTLNIIASTGEQSIIEFSDTTNARGRIYYDHSSSPEALVLETTGTTAMTINNSQATTFAGDVSVGNGTITPNGSINDIAITSANSAAGITIGTANNGVGYLAWADTDANNGAWIALDHGTNTFDFRNNSASQLTLSGTVANFQNNDITTVGEVVVGATGGSSAGIVTVSFDGSPDNGIYLRNTDNGSADQNLMVFDRNGSNTGEIVQSNSGTSYVTSSDYRLKENVVTDWDATTRLKQLKPSRFNFIIDADKTVDGFLAHEVQAIVPEAITGTKDAMTDIVLYVEGDILPEGKSVGDVKKASAPNYQGIDQSKLVPLLVKTIQELEARITALEA